MRKGQMEIMGLAIIVVLISLGLLFAIRFIINPSQTSDPGSEFRESELAANFLNAMLETNAPDCHDISFSTLFQDCANNNADGGRIDCGGTLSCAYLETALVNDFFPETLGEWRPDGYQFIASTNFDNPGDTNDHIITAINDPCPAGRKVKIQPLPSQQTLYLWLFICEG